MERNDSPLVERLRGGHGPEAEGDMIEERLAEVAQGEPVTAAQHLPGDDLVELRVSDVGCGGTRSHS